MSVDMSVNNKQQGSRHTCSELFKQDRVDTAQDGCQHLLLQESDMTIGCTLLGRHQGAMCILQQHVVRKCHHEVDAFSHGGVLQPV